MDEQIETELYKFMSKMGIRNYKEFYNKSIEDIEWLWRSYVEYINIKWDKPFERVLDTKKGIMWPDWFVGGKLNITTSLLDRYALDEDTKDTAAIIHEGENGISSNYTYEELLHEVNKVAHGLKTIGIKKGDTVLLYLPMIPENVISMLAIARIGAVFIPCFSGFGYDAIVSRLEDSNPKLIITADGFMRRGKEILMKQEVDRALKVLSFNVGVCVVANLGNYTDSNKERELSWDNLSSKGCLSHYEVMNSQDLLMIIYTSGTTGKPKGTLHVHSGFPIKASFDASLGMDLKANDVLFWVTDMGWMMGPWMVFSALLNGSTMVLYDGSPDYPGPDRLWNIVEKHSVTHLGISPTLIRALIKHGEGPLSKYTLDTLRVLASTGEPWDENSWDWFFTVVGKGRLPICNYSGGSEISGGILTNVLLKQIVPSGFNTPLPGMDIDVVNELGSSLKEGVGELVIKKPWVGMTKSFWENDAKYIDTYWSKFNNLWTHGDFVKIENNNWYIVGRSDDTIKIAGKRIGPGEIESVLVTHSHVSEAAVIGVPDEVKGEALVCFVTLKDNYADISKELADLVSTRLGKSFKPKEVFEVKDLAKTRNGKILRKVIKRTFLGEEMKDLSSVENKRALDEIKKIANIHIDV